MSFALILLSIFTTQLDAVLAARADFSAAPFGTTPAPKASTSRLVWVSRLRDAWDAAMTWVKIWLEDWTATHDDKRIAWTLGIGWACLGGGLAGGTLVFAKAA